MSSTFDKWLMDLKDGQKETTICNEATETKLNPGLMQSIEVHQDIPKGEVAVMPDREPRKHRICNLDAERRQKRKERTQENRGSRRKLAAACRKVSHHAKLGPMKTVDCERSSPLPDKG
jgi:hypothetical protein